MSSTQIPGPGDLQGFKGPVYLFGQDNSIDGVLIALGGTSPVVAGTPTIAGALALGTDGSIWSCDGTAWTPVAGSGGTINYADDVYAKFGDDEDWWIGFNTALFPGDVFVIAAGGGTPVSVAAGSAARPGLAIATPQVTTTGVGAGVDSASLIFITGGTVSDGDPGATGGDSGGLFFTTGDATSTAGTSGNSGELIFNTGDSEDGSSGGINHTTGDADAAGQTSGDFEFKTGDSVAGNTGGLTLRSGDAAAGIVGSINLYPGAGATPGNVRIGQIGVTTNATPNAAAVNSGLGQMLSAFCFRISVVTPGPLNVSPGYIGRIVDAMLVKETGAGGAGDQVDVATAAGIVFTFDLNGVAADTIVRPTTLTSANSLLGAVDQITVTGTVATLSAAALVTVWVAQTP